MMKLFALCVFLILSGCAMVSPSDSYTFDLRKMSGRQLDSECPLMIDTPQTVTTKESEPYWVLKINCGRQYNKKYSEFNMGEPRDLSELNKPVGYLFIKEKIKGGLFASIDKLSTPYALSADANYAEIIQHHPLESDGVTVIELYRRMKAGFIDEPEEP